MRVKSKARKFFKTIKKYYSKIKSQRSSTVTTEERLAASVKLIEMSGLFDPDWYSARVPALSRKLAAQHYITHGFAEGRQPSPYFDAASYRAGNADVAASGVNPLLHWLLHGHREGRASPLIGRASNQTPHLLTLCNPYQLERPIQISDPEFRISVLTPAYNTPAHLLEELYVSLLNQNYSNWEWVICDDCSYEPETLEKLRELASDERVEVIFAKQNIGISGASNVALSKAKGNYVALVDHDDLLSRNAFSEIHLKWKHFASDLFYTDECKLSIDGELYDFFYKPSWSPSFLENTMYIGHLTVYSREVVDKVGGFRSDFDGTQDYDLALRASRVVSSAQHVGVVGYLWRAIPGSTATSLSEKSYAIDRQRAAVLDHATSLHPQASVECGEETGLWRARYPLPNKAPLLSYVMPTGAGRRLVRGESLDLITNCLESLRRTQFYRNCEYIIVHNGDLTEAHLGYLAELSDVKLVYYPEPELNLARKMNLGVAVASGQYICLLNDDIEAIDERGGENIVGFMETHASVGAVAPLCLFEDGRVQHNGVILLEQGPSHAGVFQQAGYRGHFGNLLCRREAMGVTGAMLFCRKAEYEAVGGFDESFPLNYNDVDFCQKLREIGLSSVVDPDVKVFHFESATKAGTFKCEKEWLFNKWPELRDPFFNAALDQRSPYYEERGNATDRSSDAVAFENWLDRRIGQRANLYPSSGGIKLSVCVPVFNQTRAQLRELYESYRMQTYANKELIIVDDASTMEETRAWLDHASLNPDIKVVRLPENRGIAGASKAMLAACSGDYYLPVDADDFLTIDALAVMAHYMELNPQADIFYSDEFKSNPQSDKFSPYIKPDFDPLMISNCCYVTHLMGFRVKTMRRLKAYSDERATWCHDWDSTMRCVESGRVPVHVPELLYAWRISPGSTASVETGEKPAAVESQRYVLDRTIKKRQKQKYLTAEPNDIRPGTGMWRLKALETVPAEPIDVDWFWRLDPSSRRQVLERLLDVSEPDWFLFHLPDTEPQQLSSAFAAPIHWDARVAGVSGVLTDDSGNRVVWAGGELAVDGGIRNRHYGASMDSGGYYGQLFCQRCVDVMAPLNMALRRDLLQRLVDEGGGELEPDRFMREIALIAARSDVLLTITPHVLATVTPQQRRMLPSARTSSPDL